MWMQIRATATTLAYSDWYLPGQERDPRYKLEAPYCLVAFAPSGDREPTDRIQHYIRVMCHELLHSMFQIYTCACQHSHERKWKAGHDIHWQAAALAIEQSWAFGEWKVVLWRDESMAGDVFRGEGLPNEATLRRLGMDIGEILSALWSAREFKSGRSIWPRKPLEANRCLWADWIIEG